mmetsp:Transcript_94093/g.251927  ORF Transcript_94093/g.251927 Transcript_94093/m.251927 type:complete len:349 (+) Transcript_94093:766-1812(+)
MALQLRHHRLPGVLQHRQHPWVPLRRPRQLPQVLLHRQRHLEHGHHPVPPHHTLHLRPRHAVQPRRRLHDAPLRSQHGLQPRSGLQEVPLRSQHGVQPRRGLQEVPLRSQHGQEQRGRPVYPGGWIPLGGGREELVPGDRGYIHVLLRQGGRPGVGEAERGQGRGGHLVQLRRRDLVHHHAHGILPQIRPGDLHAHVVLARVRPSDLEHHGAGGVVARVPPRRLLYQRAEIRPGELVHHVVQAGTRAGELVHDHADGLRPEVLLGVGEAGAVGDVRELLRAPLELVLQVRHAALGAARHTALGNNGIHPRGLAQHHLHHLPPALVPPHWRPVLRHRYTQGLTGYSTLR